MPLPTKLAGITVSLFQTLVRTPPNPVAVPIFAVYPFPTCTDGSPLHCATLLAITVQIPFELYVDSPNSQATTNQAQLQVSDGINTTGAFQIFPKWTQIHVLRQGDALLDNNGSRIPLVRHSDGSIVTNYSPARIGEELVVYAVGLGPTTPAINTGDAAPSGSSIPQINLTLNYDYLTNALPRPGVGASGGQIAPLFVGMVMGTVGVYQFNFIVPSPVLDMPACSNHVKSNLTVTLYSSLFDRNNTNSFDGAQICVDPNSWKP